MFPVTIIVFLLLFGLACTAAILDEWFETRNVRAKIRWDIKYPWLCIFLFGLDLVDEDLFFIYYKISIFKLQFIVYKV